MEKNDCNFPLQRQSRRITRRTTLTRYPFHQKGEPRTALSVRNSLDRNLSRLTNSFRNGPPDRRKLAVADPCPPRPNPWRAAPCLSSRGHRLRWSADLGVRLGTPPSSFSANPESAKSCAGVTPNILATAVVVSPAASAKAILRRRAVNRRSHSAKSIRSRGDVGWCGPSIFDKDLLPAAVLVTEMVEPFDGKLLAKLGIVRHRVADPQAASHPAPGADLRDGEAGQRGGRRSFRLTSFHQPCESHIRIRDDFFD